MPNNAEFLQALFGEDAPWVHVTDFTYDPNNIPRERQLSSWMGDYYCRYKFQPASNQYFTISCFGADSEGRARRRKVLYRHTPVIVLDDVKEKLSLEEVNKLPEPSWVLETSPGSEQWGYILDKPCEDRHRVENLLDGLVANGLAPDGRDPGMKGVTRYVRLPEGINNKASKLVNGQPFQCRLIVWQPFHRVSLEQLAQPFFVNLDAARREARVDGAAKVDDHPILDLPDIVKINEVRSDGRFDITCPWVHEHTGQDDSGAAVFTNDDGSIGFKCHHGACQHRTAAHLVNHIEERSPGFKETFSKWRMMRTFAPVSDISFINKIPAESAPSIDFTAPTPSTTVNKEEVSLDSIMDQLRREIPMTEQARELAGKLLKFVDPMPEIDRQHWHNQIRDHMRWTKTDFKPILEDFRKHWYSEKKSEVNFFDDVIFVTELNQFLNRKKRIFYTVESYQNTYAHLDAEAKKEALQGGRVMKVDRIDYAPKRPAVFEEHGIIYGNSWSEVQSITPVKADVSPWLNHWNVLGWGEHRDHMLKYMAYTIRHPENKINHMLILGGLEGSGKDFLLQPLARAMGDHHMTIQGEDLLDSFNDYLLGTKYLNINETELGDRREAVAISNKLKPLAAAPPDRLRVNTKHVKHVQVRNIVNCTMTTNSQLPIRLNGMSRRFYALWTDLNVRDEWGNMMDSWERYWVEHWNWMNNGGAEACVHHLLNEVDISDFNPGVAPKVTDFLREIQEASKSPAQLTIEAFMADQIGAFSCDLSTSAELATTLRCGELTFPQIMYIDSKWFTPQKVGHVLKGMPQVTKLRAGDHTGSARLWVFRNNEKYRRMSPVELFKEYQRQVVEFKNKQNGLSVVK